MRSEPEINSYAESVQRRRYRTTARLTNTAFILLGLIALVMFLTGCGAPARTEKGGARQISRALAKIRENVKKYPALGDSVTAKGTVDVPPISTAGAVEIPQDSANFDQNLKAYARLVQRLKTVTDSLAALPPGQDLKPGPAGLNTAAPLIAELKKRERVLREQLRAGAYRDTVITYADSLITGTFKLTGGRLEFTYQEKPRTVDFKAPALMLNLCPPPEKFYSFWQFWAVVALFGLTFYFLITRPR